MRILHISVVWLVFGIDYPNYEKKLKESNILMVSVEKIVRKEEDSVVILYLSINIEFR